MKESIILEAKKLAKDKEIEKLKKQYIEEGFTEIEAIKKSNIDVDNKINSFGYKMHYSSGELTAEIMSDYDVVNQFCKIDEISLFNLVQDLSIR